MIRSLIGTVTAELTGADITSSLMAICASGIEAREVRISGDLSVVLEIRRSDWKKLTALCARRGDRVKVRARKGIYWSGKALFARPVLVLGFFFLLFLTIELPKHVLFVEIEGNQTIPAGQILEAARESGIVFGAARKYVRSERVKNAMLEELPLLQWVGVNTRGCVAVISVREKNNIISPETPTGVSNIIAACDGIVLSATATKGELLCTPGQAVNAGEILISGYKDCNISVIASRADGEIIAQTMHEVSVLTPEKYVRKTPNGETKHYYSIIFGKKRINLYKGSGILDAGCGRMYEETYLTLPGGFVLPVAIVKESVIAYSLSEETADADLLYDALSEYARTYVTSQMIAGTTEQARFFSHCENGTISLQAQLVCTEMIGREKTQQIGDTDE